MLRCEPPSQVVKFPDGTVSEWTDSGSVHIQFVLVSFQHKVLHSLGINL